MKITLNELTNSVQAVNKLSAFDFGTPKLNYKFMSVVETVEAESKKLIDLHRKVIEKYRDKECKDSIVIPFENTAAFNDEMMSADNLAIELERLWS